MLNPLPIPQWAAAELGAAHFGDARLTRRYLAIVAALAAQPTAPVPQACAGDWAPTKAIYRFWDHAAVTPAALRAPHLAATAQRAAAAATILAVQDTTSLDFSAHPATQELGYLDQPQARGLKVHSVLAVSLQGVPLGLLAQTVWRRDPATAGKAATRRQHVTADKESGRWLTALDATHAALPATTTVITVADREADIFDLFAAARPAHSHLLIRASHDRALAGEAGYLWAAIRAQPVAGEQEVELPRRANQPARTATVQVRYATLAIKPPRHHPQRRALAALRLQVILAEEAAPPAETAPVRWLLVTTWPVDSLDAAQVCVRWYSYRWLIERYHYVLKSGCRVEALQLRTAARLERALATYCVVAWRLLWLTYEARVGPAAPCSAVLSRSEWQVLAATMTGAVPAVPPSLGQAVRWIAQLGGFLGRQRDGAPGVQTLWRGWSRLQDMAATWDLRPPLPPG
jgi:Transposase DNA-binding/Transposase Tn5 dimerisation domain